MSQIRGKDTKPELLVRKLLFAKGFRYRLHVKNLPGKPDMVFAKYKAVLFIHGCFWHGHKECKYYVVPKTRTDWWVNKICTNITNDQKNVSRLHDDGWKVIVVWECELKKELLEKTIDKLIWEIRKKNA